MKRLSLTILAALFLTGLSFAQAYKGWVGTVVPQYVELKYKFIGRFEGLLWVAPGATPYRVTATLRNGVFEIKGVVKEKVTATRNSILSKTGIGVDLWRF